MDQREHQAQVDAATAYEDFFVPALFQEWAPRVADAAQIGSGARVLDVACGTGVLARTAAVRVGPSGFVAGLDVNPGMLAVAARLEPRVEWRQGVAEELPYPDQSFDAVVSQFGLMFFTNRRRALEEMFRVLTPGGRLAVAVWDSLENTPAYETEVALLEAFAGQAAADALRAPFVLGDRQALTELFAEARIPAEIVSYQGTARFPSIRSMVETDIVGWLPLAGVHLAQEPTEKILAEAERALHRYVTPAGSVEFSIQAHIITAAKT